MTETEPIATPPQSSPSQSSPPQPPSTPAVPTAAGAAPRPGRVLLTAVGAATLLAAALGPTALSFAGGADGAHTPAAYLLAQTAHDIGHNDWAFQGGPGGRVGWIADYLALGLGWLAAALWLRAAQRRNAKQYPDHARAADWLGVLAAAWGALALAGLLTLGVAYAVEQTSTGLGPLALHLSDLCSPWWSGAAAVAVLAVRSRDRALARAAAGYAALLALLLLVPLDFGLSGPWPDLVRALLLAVPVAALWAGPAADAPAAVVPAAAAPAAAAPAVIAVPPPTPSA